MNFKFFLKSPILEGPQEGKKKGLSEEQKKQYAELKASFERSKKLTASEQERLRKLDPPPEPKYSVKYTQGILLPGGIYPKLFVNLNL